jgi:hypothetical protein
MLVCVLDMQHNSSAWRREPTLLWDRQQRLMPRALPAREYRKEDGADSGLTVWLKMKPVFATGYGRAPRKRGSRLTAAALPPYIPASARMTTKSGNS